MIHSISQSRPIAPANLLVPFPKDPRYAWSKFGVQRTSLPIEWIGQNKSGLFAFHQVQVLFELRLPKSPGKNEKMSSSEIDSLYTKRDNNIYSLQHMEEDIYFAWSEFWRVEWAPGKKHITRKHWSSCVLNMCWLDPRDTRHVKRNRQHILGQTDLGPLPQTSNTP